MDVKTRVIDLILLKIYIYFITLPKFYIRNCYIMQIMDIKYNIITYDRQDQIINITDYWKPVRIFIMHNIS